MEFVDACEHTAACSPREAENSQITLDELFLSLVRHNNEPPHLSVAYALHGVGRCKKASVCTAEFGVQNVHLLRSWVHRISEMQTLKRLVSGW